MNSQMEYAVESGTIAAKNACPDDPNGEKRLCQ